MMTRNILDCMTLVGGTPSHYEGEKTYVSTGAVDCDHIDYDQTEQVTFGNRPSRANLSVTEGDILFAKMCGTKKTLRIDRETSEHLFSTGFCAVRANESVMIADLLYHLLASEQFLRQKDKNSSGATQKAITNAGLKKITVQIPDLSEQQESAAKLDCIEQMMAKRREQIAYFDQLVKSRFIELFESKSWDTIQAGSIMFNMRNGVSPSNTGSFPAKVLTLSAITQGSFDPAAWKDGTFDSDPPIEKRVSASDFYMCRGNGNKNLVGAGVYSKEDRHDLVFPDTAIAASIDLQKVCLPYLFHAWKRPAVREQIERGARTTNGTYKINQRVVSNIELILPPMELQEQFAAFVEQVDKSKLFGEMEVAA